MKTKITTTLLLFLTAMIWGLAFVAQVDGVEHIGSFAINGIRYPIGVISLLPVVLFFERGRVDGAERKRTVIASIVAGTILFGASTLQQIGIEYTRSAGVAGFITGLYTVLVPIGCFLIFKHKTGINVWIGAILAVIGLFLLCYRVGDGFSFGVGELLLLLGSFLWTAHVIVIDRLGKNIRSLHFALGQFSVCSVLSIVLMLIFDRPTISGVMDAKWALLYCGVLSVGVAYTLQVVAQKKADPTFAAIILSTESVFSAIGGSIFGIDSISWLGYIGCAVMFCGIVISQLPTRKQIKQNDSETQKE
ncbi:MAG: DMT family transporter [Ruminococcaceae bacterium]|nr:DMT family transporter [Oscillospiraceae bacterium]